MAARRMLACAIEYAFNSRWSLVQALAAGCAVSMQGRRSSRKWRSPRPLGSHRPKSASQDASVSSKGRDTVRGARHYFLRGCVCFRSALLHRSRIFAAMHGPLQLYMLTPTVLRERRQSWIPQESSELSALETVPHLLVRDSQREQRNRHRCCLSKL